MQVLLRPRMFASFLARPSPSIDLVDVLNYLFNASALSLLLLLLLLLLSLLLLSSLLCYTYFKIRSIIFYLLLTLCLLADTTYYWANHASLYANAFSLI